MEAKKSLVCKCGQTAVLQQHLTFSFYYCKACKDEVKDEPKKAEKPAYQDDSDYGYGYLMAPSMSVSKLRTFYSQPQQVPIVPPGGFPAPVPSNTALPAGYVALKGEQVTCDNCGHLKFFLPCDLSALVSVAYPWGDQNERIWTKGIVDEVDVWTPNVTSSDCACTRCFGGFFADRDDGTLHIKGRGWV